MRKFFQYCWPPSAADPVASNCESAISLVYLLAKELPKITCHHSSSGAYSLTQQAEEG